MRLTSVHITGFRAAADVEVEFGNLTAFAGVGGVGKSTILNALDWFFGGAALEERDLHVDADDVTADSVMVAVRFEDFNDADRAVLGRYASGSSTTLTRTWSKDGTNKLSGNALVHAPFEDIRSSAGGPRELTARYRALHERDGEANGYPEPARAWQATEASLEQWEREHPGDCERVETDAGRHFQGFAGTAFLASRFAFVHIGASTDAADELAPRRGSALNKLLTAVSDLGFSKQDEIAQVKAEAQERIESLVKDARGRDLASLSGQLTRRVGDYFPGSLIKLQDDVEEMKSPSVNVQALVSDRDGHLIEPDLQGHGLQRALVIALLHELAQSTPAERAEDEHQPPSIMLAIEEPELYQHPLQARTLAETLRELAIATRPKIQVAYSTHSPYFTNPAMFEGLRLCRRDASQGTCIATADQEAIEAAITEAGYGRDLSHKINMALADTLREAIFARAVLLTEGPSDAALLRGVAEIQGGLDRDGVALAPCENKQSMGVAIAVLSQLEIPFFAFFDADAGNGTSGEAAINRRLLGLCGETEEDWPDRGVRQRSGNFADKLESDLADIWPEFDEARCRVADEFRIKNEKSPRIYYEAAKRAGEPPELLSEVLSASRGLAAI